MSPSKVQDVHPIAACGRHGISSANSSGLNTRCFFCGGSNHKRALWSARSQLCFNCGKEGHFAKLCRSPKNKQSRSTAVISQKQDYDQESTDDNLDIATFTFSKSLHIDKVIGGHKFVYPLMTKLTFSLTSQSVKKFFRVNGLN